MDMDKTYNKGDRLDNGFMVIDRKDGVVVAFHFGPISEFATFAIDPDGNPYSGHYFKSLKEAEEDYAERQ